MPLHNALPDATATAALARHALSLAGVEQVSAFIVSALHASGGFCDRAGSPDLYYTVFGLDGLIALGADLPHSRPLRTLLERSDNAVSGGTFIDSVSRIRCLRGLRLLGDAQPEDTFRYEQALARVSRFRSADGGYSHEREYAAAGTVYAAYLVEQAYRDAGVPWPDAEQVLAALNTLRTPDGGYTNHRGTRCGTTTATAAAAILLTRQGAREQALQAASYLAGMRHPDGGYRAAPQVQFPDLLSTATALYAESLCDPASTKAPFHATAAFVEGLWNANGGFRGHRDDPLADVEYTFYALLSLGALTARHRQP